MLECAVSVKYNAFPEAKRWVDLGYGDGEFFGIFGWEFKPRAKKDLDGFLKHSPKAPLVHQAMIIKPASPSVSFTALEA